MIKRTLVAFMLITALLMTAFAFSLTTQSATAGYPYPQSVGALDGKKIMVSTTNREMSLFDRSDTGASRLAALLAQDGAEIGLINWDVPLPDDTDLVILISPGTDYSGAQMTQLWTYIAGGGNLLLIADPSANMRPNSAIIELLLNTFGIGVNPAMLMREEQVEDAEQRREFLTNLTAVQDDHPILADVDLDNLVFDGACSMNMESLILSRVEVMPLLRTSENYYGEADLRTYFETGETAFNIGVDVAAGPRVVAAVSENQNSGSRVAVLCDSSLISNRFGFLTSPPGSRRFIYPGVVSLVVNTVYWLLQSEPPEMTFEEPLPTATPTITPSPTSPPTEAPAATAEATEAPG